MTILDQTLPEAKPIEYASFVERLVARLIDGLILILPSIFIPFIVPWLYFALQEGGESGATIGKRAMGIRVVSVDVQPIGFGTATGRFFGQLLNICTCFVGYFLMFFNAKNQCLHDLITSTVVIKNNTVIYQQAPQTQQLKRSWSAKAGDSEMHFVEISAEGGTHWHRGLFGERINKFTLWQLTDGLVDFSVEFGAAASEEMKQYAEGILRGRG